MKVVQTRRYLGTVNSIPKKKKKKCFVTWKTVIAGYSNKVSN